MMHITEPMTMFTDYLLAAAAAYGGIRLEREGRLKRQTCMRLWAASFFATAVAALAGGTSHGFSSYLGPGLNAAVWKVTVYAVGLFSFFFLAGAIVASVAGPGRRWLLLATGLKWAGFSIWMIWHDEFKYVIYDYVPSMLGVLLLQFHAYVRRRVAAAGWIASGIAVSFLAAAVQQGGVRPHEHFNHNDLYHVIQMLGGYLFYRGGRLLTD